MPTKKDGTNSSDQDYVVCGCNNVWQSEIAKAMEQGAQTVEAVKMKTLASTGCGGCAPEVQRILDSKDKNGCCGKKVGCRDDAY